MVLTIAIPTYNRPDKVKNTLLQLIPQLTEDVFVRVLDNCSTTKVSCYVKDSIPSGVAHQVEVVRHRVNIGADANFIRCFELCETPYIWMLGDDDDVEPNAVQIILAEIEKYKGEDIVGINFKSNLIDRDQPVIIRNTKDLAEKLDDFGNWSFISTSVYKTQAFIDQIRYAAWGTYAMSSQLIPTMAAIAAGKTFVLSEKYLVTNVPEEDPNKAWSPVQFALGLSAILEAPVGFKKDEYKSFGKKLAKHFNCLFPADAMCIIIRSVNYNLDKIDNYHIYIFRQLILKTLDFRSSRFKQLVQYYVCLFLMKNKGALKILWKTVPYFKRKSHEVVPYVLFLR